MAFHAEGGCLDLRPDSPAYATQLRLITSRIVRATNEVAGSEAVRTVRVLPVGSIAPASSTAAPEPVATRACTAASKAPVRTSETASEGYQRASAAHQASKKAVTVDSAIAAAVER